MQNETFIDRVLENSQKQTILDALSDSGYKADANAIARELNISKDFVQGVIDEQESKGEDAYEAYKEQE